MPLPLITSKQTLDRSFSDDDCYFGHTRVCLSVLLLFSPFPYTLLSLEDKRVSYFSRWDWHLPLLLLPGSLPQSDEHGSGQ